ncbi:MAG TPA: class I SAM-dependent methyltransferase, partial [Phycisphaerae bacterium]
RLRVLFEDEYLIAIDKPRGTPSERGPDSTEDGAAEAIARQRAVPPARRDDRPPVWRPVYRLDRATSGVLLLSKLRQAGERIRQAFRTGAIQQEFVAVVRGRPPKRRMTLSPAEAREKGSSRRSAAAGFRVQGSAPPGRHIQAQRGHVATRGTRCPPRRATRDDDNREAVVELIETADRRSLVRYSGAALKPVHVRLHLGSIRLEPINNLLHLERISFVHPVTRRRIRVTSPVPAGFAHALTGAAERDLSPTVDRSPASEPRPAGRGPSDEIRPPAATWPTGSALEQRLETALALRAPLLSDPRTNAFRVLNGDSDDLPGLVAECFSDVLILQVLQGQAPEDEPLLHRTAEWYQARLKLRSVYVKRFVRARSHLPADSDPRLFDPNPLCGEPAPPEVTSLENGLSFIIRPYDGYSVGLFLDQRDNRRRVRDLSAGGRVLNLYAYTCGFSVAAAAGGAAETVSVDLSKRHLEWGKQNFAVNGLSPDAHIFVRTDATEYLEHAARKGWRFDVMIIDPPTFARMKRPRRTFTITSGLKPLLEQALPLLNPRGHLLVSTNARELSIRWLHAQVTEAAAHRRFRIIETPPLPLDFASDPDYAKGLILQF